MRILQIEDDSATAQSVELMLKSEGFNIYTTDLGEEGVDLAKVYDYDLILLDLNLPDMNGMDVLRTLRAAKIATPIMIVSGTSDPTAKVKGLNAGADDFLSKPFHRDELVARIHAIVRRGRGFPDSKIQIGRISVNLASKTVRVGSKPIHLTGREYGMLELLCLRKGATLTKEMFMNHLYGGMDEPELKIIDVFICKLRKKLTNAGGGGHIQTVWGRGYVMVEELEPQDPKGEPAAPEPMIKDPRDTVVGQFIEAISDGPASVQQLARHLKRSATDIRPMASVAMRKGLAVNTGGPKCALYGITPAGADWLDRAARQFDQVSA